jgi:hypothetical protein
MRALFALTVLLAASVSLASDDKESADGADAPEVTCVITEDEDGWRTLTCGEEVIGELDDPQLRISARDCARAGGTLAQPYTSQGDFGWYCVGAFLGAPPGII